MLISFAALPGVGKSTLAAALAKATGANTGALAHRQTRAHFGGECARVR
jgi:predicted kinase